MVDTPANSTTFTHEDLARTAQRYLLDGPLVVLGTGATIPHGLPSMGELAAHLLEKVDSNPKGWDEFSIQLAATSDLEQALHDVALPQETVETLVEATWNLVSARDLEFHKKLLAGTESFPLADLFKYLLTTAQAKLSVVTTNYDRLAEYAANHVEAYASTGVTSGWIQRFVPGLVEAERPPSPGFQGHVSVLKVHGSLDWFQDATANVVGIPLANEIPTGSTPLVVTPGVSKYREVHKDPFRTVLTASDAALRSAACYLCIGYGFNDEHVQPILLNRVRTSNIPVVLVTKSLSDTTRQIFLSDPPQNFLFLEEGETGTMIYNPENPEGVELDEVSAWQLDEFIALITTSD